MAHINKYPIKHVVFDMDGTLTESRIQISKHMCDALKEMVRKGIDISVISGAEGPRMRKQLKGAPKELMHLSQCGNDTKFWYNEMGQEEKDIILRHIYTIKTCFSDLFRSMRVKHNDLIADRGSQISFSFIGHHAYIRRKKVFDPDGSFRSMVINEIPITDTRIIIKSAGTTSLDYTLRSGTKGENLRRFMMKNNWKAKECLYIGDSLYPNGNDSTVIGIMPCKSVKSIEETESLIMTIASGMYILDDEEK